MEIIEWVIDCLVFAALFAVQWVQTYRVSFGDSKGKMKEAWDMRVAICIDSGCRLVRTTLFDMPFLLVGVPHWWRVDRIAIGFCEVTLSRVIVFFVYLMVKTDLTSVLNSSKKEVTKWTTNSTNFVKIMGTLTAILAIFSCVSNLHIFFRFGWLIWLLHTFFVAYAVHAMGKVRKRIDGLTMKMISVRVKAEQKQSQQSSAQADEKEMVTTVDSKQSEGTKMSDLEKIMTPNEAKMYNMSKRLKKKIRWVTLTLSLVFALTVSNLLPPYDLEARILELYKFDEHSLNVGNKGYFVILMYFIYHGWKPITWKR